MQLRLLSAAVVVLGFVGFASADTVTVGVQTPTGETEVTVAPGEPVDYQLVGLLTNVDGNDGLAFVSVDVNATAGLDLIPVDAPSSGAMDSFVRPDGYDGGPTQNGYEGTLIAGILVQVGGAQNTIGNTVDQNPYPIGTVVLNVAHAQVVVAEGTVTAPATEGDYIISVSNVFANMLTDTVGPVYPVEAVDGQVGTSLVIHVQEITAVEPALLSVVTVKNHTGVGDVAVPVDTTASVGVNSGAVTTESRTTGITRLELNFGVPLDASVGGLNEAAVDITPAPGVGITTSLANGDTTLVLAFAPAIPDENTYTVQLTSSVTASAGATGDRNFEVRALAGNVVSEAGAGPQTVNAIDIGLTGIRGKFAADVSNPVNAPSDVNLDGVINALDVSCVRLVCGVFANTAP